VPEAQTTCPPPAKGDGGVFFDDRNMGISWRNLMGISWEYIYIFIFIYLFIYLCISLYIYGGFLSHVGSPVVTGWLLSYTKSLSSRLFAGYPTMMTIPRTKPMAQMAISSWLPLSLTWGSSSQ
jgi:hypothetical protein